MKNYEKYHDLVVEAAARSIAVDKKGKPCRCSDTSCDRCSFYLDRTRTCAEMGLEWLNAEYEEPKVDWSKVEVDTKILVRDADQSYWLPRHFAKYVNGEVYVFDCGMTSFTSTVTHRYRFAKLYEEE